jgi:hypothetical protein
MAQPALQFFRRRGLLAKIEATEGTDSVPTTTDNGIIIMDGSMSTEVDIYERNVDKTHLGHNPFVTGTRRATVQGTIDLVPPATPGQTTTGNSHVEALLLPCAHAVAKSSGGKTTTYNPISALIPSASLYWYHADTRIKVLGSRGVLSGLMMEIGQAPRATVAITGRYDAVEEVTLPTITVPTINPVPLRYTNSVATITSPVSGSPLTVWAKMLSVDTGLEVGTTEYTSEMFTRHRDRRATFTMRIARPDLDDFNPWADRDANTIVRLTMRVYEDENPGLYTELSVRGQIEGVQDVDIDGDRGIEITGRCIPSSAGNDEYYIQFGDNTP